MGASSFDGFGYGHIGGRDLSDRVKSLCSEGFDMSESATEWSEGSADVRQTSPQQPYTMRDVGVGFVVLFVGVVVVFLLPAALA